MSKFENKDAQIMVRSILIFTLFISSFCLYSQNSNKENTILFSLLAEYSLDLLEPVTNCAVEAFTINGEEIVYVFGGIDSTLKHTGIHRRCYKINVTQGVITRIQDIPDSLGKIAMAATRIGDKIFVAGGYHVFANGREKSSALIHEFDPIGDTFTSKEIVIPVPVDDHIQFGHSHKSIYGNLNLLYLVGGWSDNRNVRDVQIYDPKNDSWGVGTPLPDDRFEFFGAT
ncbi:MAG: Kelch repeat-containing protein, partial [Salibacteraceae bacterium]